MAKVLCCKENKELCHTIEKYTDGLIFNARMNEIMETLSAAKHRKRWERKSICRINERSCAVNRCSSNRIQKGISECVYKIKKN